jgi:hypothetical protein
VVDIGHQLTAEMTIPQRWFVKKLCRVPDPNEADDFLIFRKSEFEAAQFFGRNRDRILQLDGFLCLGGIGILVRDADLRD